MKFGGVSGILKWGVGGKRQSFPFWSEKECFLFDFFWSFALRTFFFCGKQHRFLCRFVTDLRRFGSRILYGETNFSIKQGFF